MEVHFEISWMMPGTYVKYWKCALRKNKTNQWLIQVLAYAELTRNILSSHLGISIKKDCPQPQFAYAACAEWHKKKVQSLKLPTPLHLQYIYVCDTDSLYVYTHTMSNLMNNVTNPLSRSLIMRFVLFCYVAKHMWFTTKCAIMVAARSFDATKSRHQFYTYPYT